MYFDKIENPSLTNGLLHVINLVAKSKHAIFCMNEHVTDPIGKGILDERNWHQFENEMLLNWFGIDVRFAKSDNLTAFCPAVINKMPLNEQLIMNLFSSKVVTNSDNEINKFQWIHECAKVGMRLESLEFNPTYIVTRHNGQKVISTFTTTRDNATEKAKDIITIMESDGCPTKVVKDGNTVIMVSRILTL